MPSGMKHNALALLPVLVASCSSLTPPSAAGTHVLAEPVAQSSFLPVEPGILEANWKERMEQPYVYLGHRGDYRELGEVMRWLLSEAEDFGLEPVGPPFALFYDDPGRVPIDELRLRACLPLAEPRTRVGSLGYDLLPRAMVVYARVPGSHPEVTRSYPALFSYLGSLGWKQGGPVREIYLVDPTSAATYDELWTEVQIPLGRTQ